MDSDVYYSPDLLLIRFHRCVWAYLLLCVGSVCTCSGEDILFTFPTSCTGSTWSFAHGGKNADKKVIRVLTGDLNCYASNSLF